MGESKKIEKTQKEPKEKKEKVLKPKKSKKKVVRSYKLEVSKSGRASCRKANLDPFEDKHMIEKGSVRLGYETFMARMMNYSFLFTELCCITPSTVKKVLARYEGVSQVPGYGELSADQQREVREYFKSLEGEEDEVEDEHEAMENT